MKQRLRIVRDTIFVAHTLTKAWPTFFIIFIGQVVEIFIVGFVQLYCLLRHVLRRTSLITKPNNFSQQARHNYKK